MSEAILRLATLDDVLDIETLIRGSIRDTRPVTSPLSGPPRSRTATTD